MKKSSSLSNSRLAKILHAVRDMSTIHVTMSGDERCWRTYKYFTKPHPRFPLVKRKEWGVALIELPDDADDFRRGKKMQALRTNSRRAVNKGYKSSWIKPSEHIEEIIEVNTSADIRGGRPMTSNYMDPRTVEESFLSVSTVPAVVDADGRVRAYVNLVAAGEVAIVSRILGHAQHLNNGIMYLLIDGIVDHLIAQKTNTGLPLWLMYDTFFGAPGGLWYFKERLGFRPYRVKWEWRR